LKEEETAKSSQLGKLSRSYILPLTILSASTFALRASTNMFNTNLPLVAREIFSFKNASVGTLSGLVALCAFISITFVNARLRSKWRRRLFIGSAFGYFGIFSFAPLEGPIGIWIIAAAAGFFVQSIQTNQANASGIIGKTKSGRERGITLYTVSLSASLVVGPLVNSFILSRVPLSDSFAVFSVFPLTAAILALFIPFPKEEEVIAATTTVSLPVANTEEQLKTFAATTTTNQDIPKIASGSFRDTLKNPGFQSAIFNNALYSIPFAALVSFGGLFSKDYYHATNIAVQYYFAIFFAVSFLVRALILFSHRANIRLLTAGSTVFSLLGVTLLVTSASPLLYGISMAILGIPHGLTYPSSLIIISRSSSEAERNTLNSYFASFSTMINVLTPFLIGIASELVGLRFAFSFLLVTISIFAILIFQKLSKWKSLSSGN
jgi:DHA1 family multidrug resistance protein-like MFS transporter